MARNDLIPSTYKGDLYVWEKRIITTTDQDVTNNSTRQNSAPSSGPALSLAVTAGDVWFVNFGIVYSGSSATGDYKWAFTTPANTVISGNGWTFSTSDTGTQFTASSPVTGDTLWPSTEQSAGTDASQTKRLLWGQFTALVATTGNIVYTFANAAAAAGRISRTCAGSYMYCRRNSIT